MKNDTQKSKITNYFQLNQNDGTGLAAGAGLYQSNIRNDFEGGESGGRHSSGPSEGVGGNVKRISVPNDQRNQQVQDKDSGGT